MLLVESNPAEDLVPELACPAPAAPGRFSLRLVQVCLLALLFAGPALMCIHNAGQSDNDVWWHLRTGEWIAAHHAVPHIEPFSRPSAGTPWVAYSWLFEVLVFGLFHSLGLIGLVAYSAGFVLLITAALYRMIEREGSQLPSAALLTFFCMYSMGHLFTPRPWLFTIFFFVCELDVIMRVRSTGSRHPLFWLPVIFALWANLHIQFVYGLAVLALAAAEAAFSRWWPAAQQKIGAAPLLGALIASVAATFANPYGWRVYAVIHDLASETGALNKISELQAIPFRDPGHYAVLLLAMASAAILGRQRRLISFEGALLAFACLLAFRSQRDVWIVAIVAAAVLAPALASVRPSSEQPSRFVAFAALIAAAFLLLPGSRAFKVTESSLEMQLAQTMPVHAVENIARNHYPGPIFNDFNWGGYLIWSLRQPVSIDGRQNVYGDQRMDRSVATWSGQPDWASDPDLAAAGVVLSSIHSPLAQLLRQDSRFQLAYHDDIADVFTARRYSARSDRPQSELVPADQQGGVVVARQFAASDFADALF